MDTDAKAMIAVWLKIGGESAADDLQDACERLLNADGEVVLDLSSVRRIDPPAITALDSFAAQADDQGVNVVLRGVSAEVYKVLKLVKLTGRFSFLS